MIQTACYSFSRCLDFRKCQIPLSRKRTLLIISQSFHFPLISNLTLHCNSFFQYCLGFSKNPQLIRSEENQPRPAKQTIVKTTVLPNGEKHEEEVEHVLDYSWRNFFSAINFARIMHKLSKGRSHRIGMLVQYKSSVSFGKIIRRVPHRLCRRY